MTTYRSWIEYDQAQEELRIEFEKNQNHILQLLKEKD